VTQTGSLWIESRSILWSMDELYLLARTPIAMARACPLEDTLSSQIAAIEPFKNQFSWTLQALRQRQESNFDVEIVNDLHA
jgi:hypothetical protein